MPHEQPPVPPLGAPSHHPPERSGDDAALSRRRFLSVAGSVGAALTLAAPRFTRALHAEPAPPLPSPFGAAPSPMRTARADLASFASGFKWRMLGPFRGGRVPAACGVHGRPNEFYFGAANGGVWKTIDAGRVWTPVFDGQPVASIGAVAVAPSAPDVVYVGTGENTLRDSMGFGNGVYKSTDGGRTWKHLGLDATHHIGKIAVDPRNPDVAFVAAIGNLYTATPDRGVYRTRDGGKTWQKVLFKNDDVGAVEVVIDPANPSIVYAGLWNTRRPPWYSYAPTNGPGGGIYKSTDGGSTWKALTNGLPKEGIGRTGIAVAPSDPKRVYAVVDCLLPEPGAPPAPAAAAGGRAGGFGAPSQPQQGGFFRSDDGGASWTRVSSDQALWGRGWYFEKVAVDPKNADVVYVPNVAVSRSMDGGHTWVALRGSPGGDDYHQAWVSPDDPNTMIVASDQGAIITHNAKAADPRDVTWSSWLNQPTAQIYHVSVDYRFPYWVTGAQQDSGAVAVRSRGKFGEISMRDWEPIGAGGESGMTAGDPLHPGHVYGGTGQCFDLEANAPVAGTTSPVSSEPARADWTQPLVISHADPRAMYYANQFLFKSTDRARSWTVISPDLTRPEGAAPSNLDAAAAAQTDRNGKRGVIYAVCPSPLLVPMVWCGTDDGLIHVTTNDGKSWQNVTPPAIGAWSRVTGIDASHFDFNTAYASVSRHQLGDFDPYIYRTRDQGKTWQRIVNGLPKGVYVHVVKEDPQRQGLLFAGTERGVHFSLDDGESWQPLQANLPVTSVRDFEVYGDDLIVATHGRGFWVIDDIGALRQLTDAVLAADAHLFKPSDAVNVVQGGDNGTPLQKDEPQAPNPTAGAAIDFYLKAGATGEVKLEILDASGAVLQNVAAEPVAGQAGGRGGRAGGIPNTSALWRPGAEPFPTSAGLHRVYWNPVAPGSGRGGRGGGGGRGGMTLLTGTFTARLTVSGRSYSQSFVVRPDPRARS
ncbi:MAG: hypothetical protein HY084_11590 [Gemmatimonadetes bacterium]|nr:hypothetical protein [Gemmatimonadota bacterium]